MSLIRELKRRHVIRVAAAYIAIGWVVMQFASIVEPRLGLPEWTQSTLFLIGLCGLPLALWLAWTYQITPNGIRRADDVEQDEAITGVTRHKLNKAIVILLTAALVLVLVERLILQQQAQDSADAGSSLNTP